MCLLAFLKTQCDAFQSRSTNLLRQETTENREKIKDTKNPSEVRNNEPKTLSVINVVSSLILY